MRADGAGPWCPPGLQRPWSVWPTMLPDGLLIWLQPDPSESEAAAQANAPAVPMAAQPALPAASILALAQDHGRVGLFVREIDTGRPRDGDRERLITLYFDVGGDGERHGCAERTLWNDDVRDG